MSRTESTDRLIRRLTAIVRGPEHLREDIADEIADHLACHAEEEVAHRRDLDPAAAEAEAVHAFGDPDAIARELRTIHLGDWIMFQRIMVAALVVIVIGIAVTAYFSWSAAHQQGQQLAKMNEQLTSLIKLQESAPQRALQAAADRQAAAKLQQERESLQKNTPPPPTAPLYFYVGDKGKPAANYEVSIRNDQTPEWRKRKTDSDGRLSVELDTYLLAGSMERPPGADYAGEANWQAGVRITKDSRASDLEFDVGPTSAYQVELDLSAASWDPKVPRKLELSFSRDDSQGNPWQSWRYSLDWPQPETLPTITGLFPGKATASIRLKPKPIDVEFRPGVTGEQQDRFTDSSFGLTSFEVSIPAQAGRIVLKPVPPAQKRVFGIVFDGSRERPLANESVRLCWLPHAGSSSPPQRRPRRVGDTAGDQADLNTIADSIVGEYLKTNANGEFTLLRTDPIGLLPALQLDWHTPDNHPVTLCWQLAHARSYNLVNGGTLYEFDLSKFGTARVIFDGIEELTGAGYTLNDPLEIASIRASSGAGSLDQFKQSISVTKTPSIDLLLLDDKWTADGRDSLWGRHVMHLNLVTERSKEGAPELIARTVWWREITFDVKAGEVTEVHIPLGKLDEWKASSVGWKRVEPPASQSQPAQ